MNDVSKISSEIAPFLDKGITNLSEFEEFSRKLQELGINRLIYDTLRCENSFYSEDQFICSLPWQYIQSTKENENWKLGNTFDSNKVIGALQEFDSGKISALEFHRKIFLAGVVLCHAYLQKKRIFYSGIDGQYYLEQY